MIACTLALGDRDDAGTWEDGCRSLGFSILRSVRKAHPTPADLRAFFASDPDWMFLAGHSWSESSPAGIDLANEDFSIILHFMSDRVLLRDLVLSKGNGRFRLNTNCKLVLWGGCNTFKEAAVVKAMRALFGPHLMLGFGDKTKAIVVNAVLGGSRFREEAFFARVGADPTNLEAVRNAWLNAAISTWKREGFSSRVARALDPDGQEWVIRRDRIEKGRLMNA